MSYRDEIEKKLKRVPIESCVDFATRSALRVLPLLALMEKEEEPFWYWKNSDKSTNFLSILGAPPIGFALAARNANNYNTVARASIRSTAAAAVVSSFSAVFSVSIAVATSDKDAIIRATTHAAGNALDAAHVAYLSQSILTEAKADLNFIQHNPTINSFQDRPLWGQNKPEELEGIWQRLQQWAINLNMGFEVWLNWYQGLLDGESIYRKTLDIPAEISAQGVKAVNAYLEELVSPKKPLQPLNQVRSIFIGNGAAGKTSLIRALHKEDVIEGKEDMTPGIDIRKWTVPDTDITAHFWDFGGQVIAHATHQFFLRERCLYVLVIDPRAEINANEQAEYWLEHVKTFGKSSPVMLVGNKLDLGIKVNLDMHTLSEKYPNITGFYSLSCSQYQQKYQLDFDDFKRDFIGQLQAEVERDQVYFTEEQFKVMQTLQDKAKQEAFSEKSDFEKLCADEDITNEEEKRLLDLLDKLGVIIHFPQLPRLDSYILNPRWLTYGIYTLLYSARAKECGGVLTVENVLEILKAKKVDDGLGHTLDYSFDKCGFIIDAMEEFKLCFRPSKDRSKIIIPDLLPSDQPEHHFNKQKIGNYVFEFAFEGFLPRHVMPALIVSRYDEIKENIRWQQGVLFHGTQYDCDALIQVDYHNRTLSLWLQGAHQGRYFTVLRDEIISILSRMTGLQYREWLWLTEDMRINRDENNPSSPEKASFKQLLNTEKIGQTDYISDKGVLYDMTQILKVMPVNLRQNVVDELSNGSALNKTTRSVKIFISYSHKDEKYKDELITTLKVIQREYSQLEWWDDRKLVSGQYKKQIFLQLEKAEIVLLLISRDFMASDFCYKKEMQKALEKYEQKGHLVIPIIIRETEGWENHEIGKHLALPKDGKPLEKWKHPDRFWADVQRGLDRELENLLVNY